MISQFSFAPASGPPQPSAIGLPRARVSRSVGLILAVLLHVLGIWMLIARDPLVIQPPSAGTENAITFIAPLAEASAPQPITPPLAKPKPPTPKPPAAQPKKPTPKVQPKPPVLARSTPPRRITPPQPAVAATEPLTPAPDIAPTPDVAAAPAAAAPPALAEDFSARIDAARKRRAEAQAQDPALAASETESQRANRIARENIAFSQRGQGAAREQTGGIFDLRNVSLHRAEFTFRGWNPNFKRNWLQLVEVEQGTEVDIEQAVVTKMIGVIRANRQGEFIFESRRLGRQVTQNADPAYEQALRTFLLKEFFPNYVRSGGSAR